MCQTASLVATKDRVFWSKDGDSHEQIIKENGLHDDGVRGPNIVRFEISPPANAYSMPLGEWAYSLGQDILPDWYDAEDVERRGRAALEKWAEVHILRDGGECKEGQTRIVLGGALEMSGGVAWGYGSATINQSGGRAWGCGSATINQSGGVAYGYGSATINQSGGEAWGCGSATINDLREGK